MLAEKRYNAIEEMNQDTKKFPIIRVNKKGRTPQDDFVVKELSLTVILNNRELVTIPCSPSNLDYLAVGVLLAKGPIAGREDIKKITIDDGNGIVRVEAEETNRSTNEPLSKQRVESDIEISAAEVFALIDEFVQHSELFKATGGVHSAALCDKKKILVFSEDISRHSAIDKIFGRCILEDIPTAGRLLITSGRVSSEVVLKVAKRNIPLLISKSAPTDLGVKLADDLGVTLIGFARDKRMNVYANDWRVKVQDVE
jgi:FdhD protein